MKTSELIKILEKIIRDNGDINIKCNDLESNSNFDVEKINIKIDKDNKKTIILYVE